MDSRIILVSLPGKAQKEYLKELEKLSINVEVVESYSAMHEKMIASAHDCIMIDMLTKIRLSKTESDISRAILHTFPSILLKYDSSAGRIHTTYYDDPKDAGTIGEFVAHAAEIFNGRRIRASERKDIHFNVLLGRDERVCEETAFKSFTLNVSTGGCFIFCSEEWDVDSSAWFIFKELEDQTPMRGEVRWIAGWGKSMRVPGIGIMLKDLSSKQAKELEQQHKNYFKVHHII
ncbi:MAG: PilZ domain-containing protein [Candidatus Omnitrophica bacterium]|nr:PilZ domain-containing protein [Candidatus Omnitrophota bacterium]